MSLREFYLTGKAAIVIGAGRGIGKGIALTLAEAGAEVLVAARTETEIEQTASEIRQLGTQGLAVQADATQSDDLDKIVDRALAQWDRIDILVNSGGAGFRKTLVPLPGDPGPPGGQQPALPVSEEEWRSHFDVNLTSIFLATRAVGPQMIKQRKGKITNITSMTATKAFIGQVPYCTSKAAVSMYTRALALEWAQYNINVNAIGPGYVPTQMTAPLMEDDDMREKLRNKVPLKRFCDPREVGLLAVYLASQASDYLTGQTIYLDGGMVIR